MATFVEKLLMSNFLHNSPLWAYAHILFYPSDPLNFRKIVQKGSSQYDLLILNFNSEFIKAKLKWIKLHIIFSQKGTYRRKTWNLITKLNMVLLPNDDFPSTIGCLRNEKIAALKNISYKNSISTCRKSCSRLIGIKLNFLQTNRL